MKSTGFQLLGLLMAAVIGAVVGCGGSPSPKVSPTSATAQRGDPKIRLASVFDRYQSTSHYVDEGQAVLRVEMPASDSQTARPTTLTQRAPLRVCWDGHELTVTAYTVRLRAEVLPSQTRLTAWIEEPETSNFDRQVLRQSWSSEASRVSLDRLFADEVLRSRLSVGLAGPPPQLEWLFAQSPMSRLFDDASQFKWLDDAEFDSQACQRIEVRLPTERYVFWIVQQSSLIARVDLPVPAALTSGALGAVPSSVELSLQLRGAAFAPPLGGTASEHSRDALGAPGFVEQPVRRFVPVPPPPPSPVIGRTIAPELWARLRDRSADARPLTLLTRLDASSEAIPATLSSLAGWFSQSWSTGQYTPVQWLVCVATPDDATLARSLVGSFATVLTEGTADAVTAQLRLPEGAIAVVDRNGRVLFIESSLNGETLGRVTAVINDTLDGVDVPQRIRRDYEQLTRDYQAALEAATH